MNNKRTSGFTLIELLVVVAVILLLLALLLPALESGMAKVKMVQCLSNMRQLGQAWIMYSGDNHGAMVGNEYDFSYDWVNKNGGPPNSLQRHTAGALWPYVGNHKVYRCPSEPYLVTAYSIPGPVNCDPGSTEFSKVQNARLVNILNAGRQALFVEESDPRLWSVGENQGAFWIVDGPPGSGHTTWTNATDWPAWWRHQNSMNIVFCDGHGENWRAQDPASPLITQYNQWYWVDSVDFKRFWRVYQTKI
jgi:prepilin-type N-terminal cleavage/methylation domain-containing protein/prepilin-type processing-associated H-X9-DG protein